MLVVRVFEGIQSHFKARMTEWIMTFPTAAIAFGLIIQPDMFKDPSFSSVARWGSERTWMWLILFCFFARTVALVVNGTFEGFRHSPHLRVLASLICFNFWAWFSVGFLGGYLLHGGSFFNVPACFTLCMIEGLNTFRATTDIGHQHRELKRAGKWNGKVSLLKRF